MTNPIFITCIDDSDCLASPEMRKISAAIGSADAD